MTTTQILKLDDERNTGRRRADERLIGNRYVLAHDKGKPKRDPDTKRGLREVAI